MTDSGGTWERLDAPASVPATAATPPAAGAVRTTALRLRRSRGPVIAALDGGGAIFQRRLRDVLVGSTLILVPAVALNFWVTVLAFDRYDPNITGDTGSGIEDVATFVGAVFVSFTTAAVGHFVAQLLIGDRFRRHIPMAAALRRTARRLPAIFAAWLITHWWFVLAVLVIVSVEPDSSAGLVVVFSPVAWFASAAALLVIPVMVGENLGPYAAAKRNWQLMRLRYGVCLIFVLLATLLSGLLLMGIGTLVPLLEEAGFITFGELSGVVQGVMLQLSVLVVVPLVALGTAQAYIEVRVLGEGLDLAIETDRAFPQASTSS